MSSPRLPPTAVRAVQEIKGRVWTQERRLPPRGDSGPGAGRPDWLRLEGTTLIDPLGEPRTGPPGLVASSPGALAYVTKSTKTVVDPILGSIPEIGIVALRTVQVLLSVRGVWDEPGGAGGERYVGASIFGVQETGDGPEAPGALADIRGVFVQSGSTLLVLAEGNIVNLRVESTASTGINLNWTLGVVILEPGALEVSEGGGG